MNSKAIWNKWYYKIYYKYVCFIALYFGIYNKRYDKYKNSWEFSTYGKYTIFIQTTQKSFRETKDIFIEQLLQFKYNKNGTQIN